MNAAGGPAKRTKSHLAECGALAVISDEEGEEAVAEDQGVHDLRSGGGGDERSQSRQPQGKWKRPRGGHLHVLARVLAPRASRCRAATPRSCPSRRSRER